MHACMYVYKLTISVEKMDIGARINEQLDNAEVIRPRARKMERRPIS